MAVRRSSAGLAGVGSDPSRSLRDPQRCSPAENRSGAPRPFVRLRGDEVRAQTKLDAIYGSDRVRVVQRGYGIPGRVIASFPGRDFQFWAYRVGHGELLVRSPNYPESTNVDLIFDGVEFASLPRYMHGVRLEEGSAEDADRLDELANERLRELLNVAPKWTTWAEEVFLNSPPTHVFVLISENTRYLVVAGTCDVQEHEGDMFQSPFHWPFAGLDERPLT